MVAVKRLAVLPVLLLLPQVDLRERLHPITASIRQAGVYHVATGTWTRAAKLANLAGPDVVYDNTCAPVYFLGQARGEKIQHQARLPSPTGPITPSAFYGPPRKDEAPGSRTSYTLEGFEVAYCSSSSSSLDYHYAFADSYVSCVEQNLVPTYTVTVTGLPGAAPDGTPMCWIVDVDLSGSQPPVFLMADGDGVWTGPSTAEQFGWSFHTSSFVDGTHTGPIIAGDFTWTGGSTTGILTPCTGTDGTIWDAPVNLAEAGTGMASSDFFRLTDTPLQQGQGCYNFGGHPHSDFYLRLFADVGGPEGVPMASFCHPALSGVRSCPCANPPIDVGRGCANSSASGGATLSASGYASLASDSVVFTTRGERPSALSILAQGDAELASGAIYGQGVRCVAGSIERLYTKQASAGSITAPGAGDPSVSARSAARGDPIPAGATRNYFVYYRDPIVLGGCPAASTFNATQAGRIPWSL